MLLVHMYVSLPILIYYQPHYLILNRPTCLVYLHIIYSRRWKKKCTAGRISSIRSNLGVVLVHKNKEVIIQIMNGPPHGGVWIMGKKDREICIILCMVNVNRRREQRVPSRTTDCSMTIIFFPRYYYNI